MSSEERLPQPYEPGPLAGRGSPVPARRPSTPPVHDARRLGFAEGPDREYWWDLISEAVRRRIEEKVGRPIEWWAWRHATEKNRPYAVVFGPKGLAVTTPTTNNAGRPAHLLNVRPFEPGSVRWEIVRQQPTSRSRGRRPGDPGEQVNPDPRLPLSADTRGFLGNLPVEAQARLQAPFLDGDQVQDSGYYYYGSDERVNVWCYLAGARSVTFASGLRVAAAGAPPQAAAWDMICRMATVVKR